jgi:hypothetical protein
MTTVESSIVTWSSVDENQIKKGPKFLSKIDAFFSSCTVVLTILVINIKQGSARVM